MDVHHPLAPLFTELVKIKLKNVNTGIQIRHGFILFAKWLTYAVVLNGGMIDLLVFFVGNGYGEPSLNPGQGCLDFFHLVAFWKYESMQSCYLQYLYSFTTRKM